MQNRGEFERSESRKEYRTVFVHRVHQLLQVGYQRMRPARKFEMWDEEEISGELGRHIDDVLDEITEPWMRFFSLAPERHVDEPHLPQKKRRLGKRRRRLDFRFTSRQRIPIPRFIFEAKSLKQSGTSQLLDDDGLGRILDGHYGRDDSAAGLLGYVQLDDELNYAGAFAAEMKVNARAYNLCEGGDWTVMKFPNGPAYTFRTRHRRRRPLQEVDIFFTFFLFH